ncbi:hypothetical protein TanjilG_28280 [Lupinus angustifolius]|uniref:Wound-induced protein 1 n=1 Tax=Lupinus angustifolius TaxID=3871 RepID=A0A1J7FVP4_LUPAN|nr:PREDICTED: wound-induced protein 1-like [Lupinus angustifolius]XP_019442487.1 PREDICTED: wound-induced protein 1-like [Lupinus angustifolius]OIV92031.1 hypothetical protein TanjilG_06781 [Lupinus angustifolius]OIW11189.1 hypothetical protein TanjilG_28280 [Lupinus angustifolius]
MNTTHGECDTVKATVTLSSEQQNSHRKTVKTIYKALRDSDTKKLSNLVGTELEWWYHGPHHCQYMMEMLTGKSTLKAFKFKPRRMKVIGDCVIVEGWEEKGEYWVHLWRFKEGIVDQIREYFNTLITLVVRDYEGGGGREARLWRSTSRARVQGSLPDLVLAV